MEIIVNIGSDLGVELSTQVGANWEDGEPITLGDLVVKGIIDQMSANQEVWRPLRERVDMIRNEEIREALRPSIEKALEAPLRRTTNYGEPTGPETTLREIIVDEVRSELSKSKASNDSRYGGTGRSLIGDIVHAEVERQLAGDLRKAVEDAKTDLVATVRAKGAEVITETIKRAIT